MLTDTAYAGYALRPCPWWANPPGGTPMCPDTPPPNVYTQTHQHTRRDNKLATATKTKPGHNRGAQEGGVRGEMTPNLPSPPPTCPTMGPGKTALRGCMCGGHVGCSGSSTCLSPEEQGGYRFTERIKTFLQMCVILGRSFI